MPVTTTPVILYSAAGQPVGPQGGIRAALQFYRPSAAADTAGLQAVAATGPASGAPANPIGNPVLCSDLTLEFDSVTHTTTGVYGQNNNDPIIMRGAPKLNLATFVNALGEAGLFPGDYIEVSIGTTIASTPASPVFAPISRWVVTANSLSTSGVNKWNLKLELDRVNSAATLNLF